jgi:hypothetical protein
MSPLRAGDSRSQRSGRRYREVVIADDESAVAGAVTTNDETVARALLDGQLLPTDEVRQQLDSALRRRVPDRVVHAAALWLAHHDRADLRVRRSHARGWIPGLVELIDEGHLDAAASAAPLLHEAYPQIAIFEYLAMLLGQLPPPAGDERDAFVDDPARDVQVVTYEGADTVLFAFCGARHTLSLALNLIDRWLGQLGMHVVYLRDWRKIGYIGGVSSLGDDIPDTVHALRSLTKELHASRIVCMGNSAGASGALRYAPGLGAERVLAFAPITGGRRFVKKISPEERLDGLRPWGDLVRVYRRDTGVRARLLFGADNEGDRQQSLRMAGLPGVSVEAIPGWDSHHLMEGLLRSGHLARVLGWLASATDELDFEEAHSEP